MRLLLIILITVDLALACGNLFGGGGGCGGGCGCGRKKRSIEKHEFYGVVSNEKDVMCNSPELKFLMAQNMGYNEVESSKSLQVALEAEQMERYVVICSKSPFTYSVRRDTAYCGATNGTHFCQAFAI